MKNKVTLDEGLICKEYRETNIGIETMALKYHVGKKKIKEILEKNGITFKQRGAQTSKETFIVSDWRVEKYPMVEGKHYIATDRKNGYQTNDYMNAGGFLTTHIHKTYAVEIPTLYDRRMYYMRTGNYWWEQWFDIRLVENKETKKCPYCDWETEDLENKSGTFITHLCKEHHMTVEQYIEEHPEDISYFSKFARKKAREEKLQNEGNYVICPICGERFEKLTQAHIEKLHGLVWEDFKRDNPDIAIMSNTAIEQINDIRKFSNLVVSKNRFISKYERELYEYITGQGFHCETNRQILDGKEIDILIPEKHVAIEFDGLRFHTEWFGKKNRWYHLDKTKTCNRNGYGLIHIFEDEYANKKEIVYRKLSHILGLNVGKEKVYAKKCFIKEILSSEAEEFLDLNHIQGYVSSTIHYGAFFNDELISVMSFKQTGKADEWELTRCASSDKYIYCGVSGKIFSVFVKEHDPSLVVSFADRRWTINSDNNLYTKIGFELERILKPEYRYYNSKVSRYERFHKFGFRKAKLSKKYGLPMSMTESEMAKELGYDRIWDCGLFRYVWKKK